MPACHRYGVSARLITAPLTDTLPTKVKLRMGSEQAADAQRITKALLDGEKLVEKSLASDGDVQYLGEEEDMPLYTVLVGDATGPTHEQSTRATPSVDQFETATAPASNPKRPDAKQEASCAQQAISIGIEMSQKTFRHTAGESLMAKEVLIEVYLNGELVNVVLLQGTNWRRLMEKDSNVLILSGTRIHRQIEKPWVYAPPSSSESSRSSSHASSRRWEQTQAKLSEHVQDKMPDGNLTISGRFMQYLAWLPIPEHLKSARHHFAVIDIVFVAGEGMKYGAKTEYLLQPTLLRSLPAPVSSQNVVTPKRLASATHHSAQHGLETPSPSTQLAKQLLNLSTGSPSTATAGRAVMLHELHRPRRYPEVPLSYFTTPYFGLTGSPQPLAVPNQSDDVLAHVGAWAVQPNDTQFAPVLTNSFNIGGTQSPHQSPFRDNHNMFAPLHMAMPPTTEKSLRGRAADQDKGRQAIDFRATASTGVSYGAQSPVSDDWLRSTRSKNPQLQRPSLASRSASVASPDSNIDPRLRALSQVSTDNALGNTGIPFIHPEGSRPSSPTAYTPQLVHTPKRIRLNIDGLASGSSPASTSRHYISRGSETPQSSAETPDTPRRPGSCRTGHRWNPNEPTAEDAEQSFVVPELTVDSAVTYAAPGLVRQIPKIRGGAFREDNFICGMRFIVE